MKKSHFSELLRTYFVVNYKSTAAGLATLATATGLVVTAFPLREGSTQQLLTALPMLCTGIGLILSKDATTAVGTADALPPPDATPGVYLPKPATPNAPGAPTE